MTARSALSLGRFPIFLTVVLAVALVAVPGRSSIAVRVYVLLLAAFALAQLLARLRGSLPAGGASSLDAALNRRPRRPERVPELEKMEREVALGLTTAFDLHFRLRPTLRRIASELLRARRGIDLDADREAARRALGEETWEVVREDREPPHERFGRGLDLPRLRTIVDSLEAL
ncbi:MAG: hypothetical protein ACXWZB_04080 [Gaiellaceae bacterium]